MPLFQKIRISRAARFTLISICMLLGFVSSAVSEETKRITILYDAFGSHSDLEKDWGFSALIEYGGKRILFDTGNDAGIFKKNVKQSGVDLTKLDAVVISHRHGDHTSGLSYLLEVNPNVVIYAPEEGGYFRGPVPLDFLKQQEGLPADMRYYDGKLPENPLSGTPWEKGNFQMITKTTEILPGFIVFSTQSKKPGTVDMNEISLAIRTPKGLAVVVGCSHPGIENILEAAAKIDQQLYTVFGGFHLVKTPEPEVKRVASTLHDTLKISRIAPGHCTSELGFSVFMDTFKDRFDRAGLGSVTTLP